MRGALTWLAPCLVVALSAIAPAQDAPPSIHAVAYTAVKRGEVEKTRLLGWDNQKRPFDESNIKGGLLIGFDLGLSLFFDKEVVTALRPVYRTSAGLSYGREYGKFDMAVNEKRRRRDGIVRTVKLRAQPGYAVGGMRMRSGLGIDGLSLFYHKINGPALDPTPSFKSEWVGNTTGGSESALTTRGRPVVGVFGCTNDEKTHVCSLGFLCCTREVGSSDVRSGVAAKEAPPPAIEPAEPPEKPRQKEPEKPKAEAKAPEKIEPEVPVAVQAAMHRDDDLHYGFDVPDGWRPFTRAELDRANALLKARYDAGFKPKDQKGNYPYVVVQKQLAPLAGLTFEQAEALVERDNKAPPEDAEGALPDLLAKLSPDRAGLDRARKRLVTRSTVDSPAAGRVRMATVYHLGAQAVVAVQCCAKDDSFDRHLPAFARINDSFAFDDGSTFDPPESDEAAAPPSKAWANLLPIAVGAGVVCLVLPLMFLLGKKKATPAEDEDERPRKKPKESGDEPNPDRPQPRRDGTMQLMTTGLKSSAAHTMGSMGPPPYFVVKAGQRWTRIYVMREAILVIDIGVGKSLAAGNLGRSQGGLIGGAIGSFIDDMMTHRNLTRMREVMDKLDLLDTDDLVEFAKGGGRNYHLPVFELRYGRIDAPSWWESIFQSQLQGRLRLRHPRKGEFRFTFERLEDMKNAMHLLPDVLGDLLELNVVLDRRSWKYVRK